MNAESVHFTLQVIPIIPKQMQKKIQCNLEKKVYASNLCVPCIVSILLINCFNVCTCKLAKLKCSNKISYAEFICAGHTLFVHLIVLPYSVGEKP